MSPAMVLRADREAAAVGQLERVEIEALLVVPQPALAAADAVDRGADVDEVLEELRREVLVDGVLARELERDRRAG